MRGAPKCGCQRVLNTPVTVFCISKPSKAQAMPPRRDTQHAPPQEPEAAREAALAAAEQLRRDEALWQGLNAER